MPALCRGLHDQPSVPTRVQVNHSIPQASAKIMTTNVQSQLAARYIVTASGTSQFIGDTLESLYM